MKVIIGNFKGIDMTGTTTSAEQLLAEARAMNVEEEEIEMEDDEVEQHEPSNEREPDIQIVYIKNFGNLKVDVISINDIGLYAKSTKQEEDLFVPWTSIIMCSKKEEYAK